MAGGDENASTDMMALVAALDDLQHAFGCCVLAIHHSNKAGEIRGFSGLMGALDVEVNFTGGAEAIAKCLADDNAVERALITYERERLEPTSQLVLDNRETGPERVLEIVAERCPDGFDNIEDVIPRDELQAIADSYKKLARFDRESVNQPRQGAL